MNFYPSRIAVALGLAFLLTGPAFGQASRAISHQGLLTDTGGAPVADATRSVTFSIFDVSTGGTAKWTETKNVATAGGIFNTLLGSDTPITGVNFNDSTWLSIKVGADPAMTPRTLLASVPSAFGLVMPFEDRFVVQTVDLGANGSEGPNEDITVYSGDGHLGLYSNPGGVAGSGIQMGEISGGSLTNKWSMYRSTTGGGSSLLFTYGSDPAYSTNPTMLGIDSVGAVWTDNASTSTGAYALRGRITSTTPGLLSSGLYGTNAGTGSAGIGVFGAHAGSGRGVYGVTIGAGIGVHGESVAEGGTAAFFEAYETLENGGVFDTDLLLGGFGELAAETGLNVTPNGAYNTFLEDGDTFTIFAPTVLFELFTEGWGRIWGDFRIKEDLDVDGVLTKGSGTFKIDHPLDPENQYLQHSFVESPDMMNIYNGNVTTDADGYVSIELPAYFEALNRDFRYQLTTIGSFARTMVQSEIADGRFEIRTDEPNVKVSWQVTGVRKDAFAEANPVIPETDKAREDRGRYLHPEAFGLSPELRIGSDPAELTAASRR